MLTRDFVKLAIGSVWAHRMRSFLTALGIAVGIASVILLTSIGEGIHRFVLSEFTQFGTNLIAVTPGKASTLGMSGAVVSNVRPLSMDDAEALKRLPQVLDVVPVIQGNAAIESGHRSRRTMVLGVGPAVPKVWLMKPSVGRFLPDDDPRHARPFVVLGSKVRNELFATGNPLGKRIRIGSESYRVVGVMESKGQMLGFDLDDAVYIPAQKAMSMFNRESVMEVDLLYAPDTDSEALSAKVKQLLTNRHGSEDFTIITQDQMLDTLGSILNILTLAVAALGAISLLVGGIGILTIMTIAITERTPEIGLLRAVGARRREILGLFIGEAIVLASIGGLAGLILGAGGAWLLGVAIPALPTHTPWSYAVAAELVAAAIGLAAGVAPAYKAANMDPVEALRAE
ncbi:MAG: FtsX-like permease family protein [Gammaproteobacteria bacterium]|nr:FtsX-like permease family protein [Gammaproteobacteria bacterium]